MNGKPVAAVILAAGESRRMGRAKLLLPWGGGCVLDAVLDAVSAAPFDMRALVSGACREQVEAVARRHGVAFRHNPDFAAGQSTSLITGLDALPPGCAAMFLLADQPLIPASLLQRMIEAYQQTEAAIVQPRADDGSKGHPVLFAPALFPELRNVSGDVGGRPVLQAHEKDILYLPVADKSIWQDVDTPEDYDRLRARDQGPAAG